MAKKYALLPCLIITFAVVDILAQNYPDTILMPVTFYDFHSDGSNPEFECYIGGLRKGMVDNNLDADQKPVIGSSPFQNYYIKYWYRDWNDSAKNDYTVPVYDVNGNYLYTTTTGSNTAFINIVIKDTLPFLHIGNGVYEYRDDSFFPLDGKGFGYEGNNHNFAFTMELHTTFIMKPGLTFNFRGDDDVWAFINNNLVMDLGGIHSAVDGSFLTDTISGLTVGQEYPFSFFFAERHTTESHIWITSNLVSTHIATEVTIEAIPADASIPAGDSVQYIGTVWYDSTGADDSTHHLPDSAMSQQINWSFVSDNPNSNPANSSLSNSVGNQTVFTSTEAFETFTITAAYQDPVTQQITSAQMTVNIIAGPPNHLVVEETYDTSISLDKKQNDQPLGTLTISATQPSNNAYAILRDQYGNFVDYSKSTSWSILSGTVLASAANGNTSLGEGVMTKNGPSGTGMVSARDLDNSGPTYTDSFYVNVLNNPPVAHNDNYSVAEDNNLVVPSVNYEGVLFNDTDPGGSTALTAELVADVTVGELFFNQDGSFTYVPQTNYSGNVVFTYKAYDGEYYSNDATVTISIGSVIDPPIAVNDSYSTDEDVLLDVSAPGVLSNDTAFEGGGLTANLIQDIDPSQGSLDFHSNGSFQYSPASNYHGTVTFTYQVHDGYSNSNVATVSINVISQNDTPVAVNNSYSVNEDATLSVSPTGILGNDYDYDLDALTPEIVSDVSHGTLNLNSNGSFTFTPDANYFGSDNFTYKVWDGSAYSNTATVSITINPVNDRPVAAQDQYNAYEDVTLNVSSANGVLANDSDVEASSLTAVLVEDVNSSYGDLTFNSNGSFSFVPTSNFNGAVSFTYQAFDGSDYSFNATVWIFVAPVNDAPVANNDFYSTLQNTDLVVNAANGVIDNDYDIDGDDLQASLITGIGADTGTLTLNPDGSFTYDPHPAFTGNFTFTYNLSDDSTTSNTATVTINVGDVNEPPEAENDTFNISEDNTLSVSAAAGVLSNDSDPESDPLQAFKTSDINASEGSLTFNSDGSFQYVPAANFNGIVTFTYQANDTKLNSNIATVFITVTAVNDAPVANNDNYFTDEDIVLNIPTASIPGLLYNDADVENDALSVTLADAMSASEGSVILNPSGSFTFTPASNFNGTTSFTYLVYDGNTYSDTGTVTITVNSINDQPVVSDIPDQTINKGGSFQQIPLNNYVTDADHDISDITWTVSGESNLDITIDPVTHIAFVSILDSNWHGSESITFTATDPGGAYTSNTVTFTVNPLSILPMPVADKSSGKYSGHNIDVNLSVPGYADASILYTYTTDGTTPPDPKTGTPQVINGSGTISIGNQTSDSSVIKITAYSSQYPYENSENVSFEYMLIFPQLPAPVASPSSGDFDTTGLGVSLSVPDHPDAQIFYTLDGTDPATSGTKFSYTSGNPIVLGPYSQVTEATIRAYATKSYYKPGKADFGYTFNPEKLPKPVADPPGKRFHTETLSVRLYVPDQPDAVIRYTLDGSTPNLNSDLYTSEIVLNKNTTIKAIALKDGLLPGPVMTEVYIQSLPTSMKFYPDMDATTPYSSTISCNAGTPIPVIAKIFDQYDTCLTEFATENAPISWEIQEITGNETGTITNTAGYKTVFNPEKAYNTVKLIATFNSNGFVFSKEIELLIKPGDPYKMWLEADWDRLVSPNEPNPVNSIKLSSNKTNENVYGIIRDSIGNWVATSKSTIWQPAVHSVATVVSGLANFGEGVIYKGLNSGSVVVTAENTDLSLKYPKDSVDVTVLSYWYDSLKIVLNDSINNSVDSIVMNTNLDTTLYVFGFRDDGYGWEKVSANWSILDKSLKYNIANPPTSTHEYLLSPIDTASGAIKVSLDDDNVTIPDTVWVKFIPGPPVRVEFTLLTPDDSLIAGDTLTTEIRLYNGDNNLVYGTWCYPGDGDSVIYNNILDDGGRPDPYFIVDDLSYILKNQGTNAKETFVNGTDTAYFVLYYAPYDEDSLHQLSITLDQSITDNTRPFRLLPGKLNKIDIAVGDNTPDTLVMHYSNGYIIKTLGYDLYGNTISLVECNWSTTGDIPEIKYPDSTKQIYYEIDDVLYKTTGCIIAKNIDDPDIIDSVYVIIGPKPAVLSEAVTQDLTGNGYLDAIKISFDKKVLFPVNIYTDNLITLKYAGNSSNINFDIKEIIPLSASSLNESDSAYLLTFDEYTIDNEPQTDWLPLISMTGISDMESIANKQCKDGAPPVVWDVEKKKDSSGDIEKDKVYITLSEPFKSTTGSDLMYAAIQPKAVFHVWTKSESNFELEENILDGIQFFSEQNGNTLMFNTSNGNVINANHYFSLTYQECLLADVAQNTPAKNNQKVRVRVSGKIEKLIIGPNPIKPTMKFWEHEKNLPLSHVDSKVAYNKVKTYGGGIVVVDIDFSGQEFTQASAQLMVFDATGNLVHAKENRGNVIPSDWNLKDPNQNETRQLIFYWDGISDRGMMAAPGVYRAVVFIQFGRNIKKITGTVGVGR